MKTVDDMEALAAEPAAIGGLLLTREQWRAKEKEEAAASVSGKEPRRRPRGGKKQRGKGNRGGGDRGGGDDRGADDNTCLNCGDRGH